MSVQEVTSELAPELEKTSGSNVSASDVDSQLAELRTQVESLASTNSRLLDESKRNKDKAKGYNELAAELEQMKTAKLESEGNVQGLLEAERKRAKELADRLEQANTHTFKSNVLLGLKRIAPDAIDAADLLKDRYAGLLKSGMSDDGLTVSDEALKEVVDLNRKDNPHYFANKQVPSFGDGQPSKPKEKTLANSTMDEKTRLLEELLAKPL